MGNLLRRDGSGTSIKEMTDTEVGKYFGYFNLLEYVGLADSNEVGRLTTKRIGSRKYNDVGTFTDTFFNEPVGTAPGTSITSGSTTYRLYQRYDSSYAMEDSDLSLYRPLMWVDGGGQTGFKQVPESDLNANIDKALTYTFTNDGLGTYKLSEASPGVGYTDRGTVFTDTQTDGTTVNYKVWQRTGNASSFFQTSAAPLYINKSYSINLNVTVANPGSGNYYYLNGAQNPSLTTQRLNTYTFDQTDSTNDDHPLVFKNGGSAYQTGVVYYLNGSVVSASDYINTTTFNAGRSSGGTSNGKLRRYVKITIDASAPDSGLRYFCYIHGEGMGNTITVQDRSEAAASEFFSIRDLDSASTRTFRKLFQKRIQDSKIGTYQLRTSGDGAPTDPGTWVSKGSATDTKKTTADVAYVAAFANTFNINYVRGYTNQYTATYTRVYEGGDESDIPGETGYLKAYDTLYQKDYLAAYTGTFEEVYGGVQDGPAYTRAYTGTYERDVEESYQRNYARNYTGSFLRPFTAYFVAYYQGQQYTGFSAYLGPGDGSTETGDYVTGPPGNFGNIYTGASSYYVRAANMIYFVTGEFFYVSYYSRANIFPDYYPNYETTYTREFYLGTNYYVRNVSTFYVRQITMGPVYVQGPEIYTRVFNPGAIGQNYVSGTGRPVRHFLDDGDTTLPGQTVIMPLYYVSGTDLAGAFGTQGGVVGGGLPVFDAIYHRNVVSYLAGLGTYLGVSRRVFYSGSARNFSSFFVRIFLGIRTVDYVSNLQPYAGLPTQSFTGTGNVAYTNEDAGNYFTTGFGPLVYYSRDYQGVIGFTGGQYAPGSGSPYFGFGYLRVYTQNQPAGLMYLSVGPAYVRDIGPPYLRQYTTAYIRNYDRMFASYYTRNYTGTYVGTFESVPYEIGYISTIAGDYTGTFETVYETVGETQQYVATYVQLYAGDFEGFFDGANFLAYYEQDYQQGYIQEYLTDFEGTTIQASSGTEETYTLYVRIS